MIKFSIDSRGFGNVNSVLILAILFPFNIYGMFSFFSILPHSLPPLFYLLSFPFDLFVTFSSYIPILSSFMFASISFWLNFVLFIVPHIQIFIQTYFLKFFLFLLYLSSHYLFFFYFLLLLFFFFLFLLLFSLNVSFCYTRF